MSLEDDLNKLADATLPDWGDITFSGTQFDSAIRDLYRSHLRFLTVTNADTGSDPTTTQAK